MRIHVAMSPSGFFRNRTCPEFVQLVRAYRPVAGAPEYHRRFAGEEAKKRDAGAGQRHLGGGGKHERPVRVVRASTGARILAFQPAFRQVVDA